MKKIILIIWMIFILSSCFVVTKNEATINTNKVEEVKNIVVEEYSNTWEVLDELWTNNSWTFISDEWSTNSWEIIELEKKEILSIEEQYCVSKWGKLVDYDDTKICYTTDEYGLLKCAINIFYYDMCRSKTVIIKEGIIVWLPKKVSIVQEKKVESTWSLEVELWIETKDTTEVGIIENDNESENNLSEEEIIEPKTTIVKEIQWKSWKYYILVSEEWTTDFRMVTNEWNNISLFKWNTNFWEESIIIYDYELMINKQIKVFYYKWTNKTKEEKIIDLNNI